jgi:hypothetical protein
MPIFDAHTEGDVLKIRHPPQFTAQECSEPLVPLGEDLKNVPVSTSHDVADARDVVGWNVLMKQALIELTKIFRGRRQCSG